MTLEELPIVKHTEVVPMYSKDQILDKLASAVSFCRESKTYTRNRLEMELLYSLAKAFTDDTPAAHKLGYTPDQL